MNSKSKYSNFFKLQQHLTGGIISASCKYCGHKTTLKNSQASKTGLRNHLKIKHPDEFKLLIDQGELGGKTLRNADWSSSTAAKSQKIYF